MTIPAKVRFIRFKSLPTMPPKDPCKRSRNTPGYKAPVNDEERNQRAEARAIAARIAADKRAARVEAMRERAELAKVERYRRLITDCDALFKIDPHSPDAYETLLRTVPAQVRRACLSWLPSEIDPIRMIVCRHVEMRDSGTRTLNEIGDAYGLTRERIRQIWSRAASKLAQHPVIVEAYAAHEQSTTLSTWDEIAAM